MLAIEKRDAALKLLASTGMRRSNYAPPLVRLLWRLEIDAPPPHFRGFCSNALSAGTYFAIAWGAFMWVVIWSRQELPVGLALGSAVAAGVIFGLGMASYYAYGRRKYNLPSWKEFKPDP